MAYRVARNEILELMSYAETMSTDRDGKASFDATADKVAAVARLARACANIDAAFVREQETIQASKRSAVWQIAILAVLIGVVSVSLIGVAVVQWSSYDGTSEKVAWLLNVSIVAQASIGFLAILLSGAVRSLKFAQGQKAIVQEDRNNVVKFVVGDAAEWATFSDVMAVAGYGGGAVVETNRRVETLLAGLDVDRANVKPVLHQPDFGALYDQWTTMIRGSYDGLRRRDRRDIDVLFAPFQVSSVLRVLRTLVERYHRILSHARPNPASHAADAGAGVLTTQVIPALRRYLEEERDDENEARIQRGRKTEREDDVTVLAAPMWTHGDDDVRLAWKRVWAALDLLALFGFQVYAKAKDTDARFPHASLVRYMPHTIKKADVPALYDELDEAYWASMRDRFGVVYAQLLPTLIQSASAPGSSPEAFVRQLSQDTLTYLQPLFERAVTSMPTAQVRRMLLSTADMNVLMAQRFSSDGSGSPFGLSMLPESYRVMMSSITANVVVTHMQKQIDTQSLRRKQIARTLSDALVRDALSSQAERPIDVLDAKDAIQRAVDPDRAQTAPLISVLIDVQNVTLASYELEASRQTARRATDFPGFRATLDAMTLRDLEIYLDAPFAQKLLDALHARVNNAVQQDYANGNNLLVDALFQRRFADGLVALMYVVASTCTLRFALYIATTQIDLSAGTRAGVGVLTVLTCALGLALLGGAQHKSDVDFTIDKQRLDQNTKALRDGFRGLTQTLERWKTAKVSQGSADRPIGELTNISDADKADLLQSIVRVTDAFQTRTYATHPSVDQAMPFPYLEVVAYTSIALAFLGGVFVVTKRIDPIMLVSDARRIVERGVQSAATTARSTKDDLQLVAVNGVTQATLAAFMVVFLLTSIVRVVQSAQQYQAAAYNRRDQDRS